MDINWITPIRYGVMMPHAGQKTGFSQPVSSYDMSCFSDANMASYSQKSDCILLWPIFFHKVHHCPNMPSAFKLCICYRLRINTVHTKNMGFRMNRDIVQCWELDVKTRIIW